MNKVDLNGAGRAGQACVKRNSEVGQPAQAEQTAAKADDKTTIEADKVNVSERGASIERLASRAAGLPDVRQERVEHLRQLVQSGSYNPPAKEIADAIIKDEK